MSELKQIHRILEGTLFAAGEPLTIDRLVSLFDASQRPEKKVVREALNELTSQYDERGLELKELASGYQFQVKADLAPWVKRLWDERPPRYSRALMETLALVAYRQPITRAEIEEVRGVVVSTNIMRTLLEHGWVRIVGHKDVPGKPGLYATTKQFLDCFGLKSLSELPPLSEIKDIFEVGKALENQLKDEEKEILAAEQLKEISPENITVDEMIEEADHQEIKEDVDLERESVEVAGEQNSLVSYVQRLRELNKENVAE